MGKWYEGEKFDRAMNRFKGVLLLVLFVSCWVGTIALSVTAGLAVFAGCAGWGIFGKAVGLAAGVAAYGAGFAGRQHLVNAAASKLFPPEEQKPLTDQG
jgi:hypothetical protein